MRCTELQSLPQLPSRAIVPIAVPKDSTLQTEDCGVAVGVEVAVGVDVGVAVAMGVRVGVGVGVGASLMLNV